MADFESVLDKKIEEVEKPKPKPVGTYLGVLQGLPTQKKVGQDEMDVIGFRVKLIAPQDDVDAEALADQPPISEWPALRHDIFVHTEQGVWGLKQFLSRTLGFEEGEGKTIRQSLAETPGRQLLVKLRQRPFINRDNQPEIATEIESTAHV